MYITLSTSILQGFNFSFKGIDFKAISQVFNEAPKQPVAIFALAGLVILALVILRVRKVKLTTTIMTQVGVAIALGTVLKMVKFYQLPNGGSATLGSMIPVFLIALFYGPEVGMLTGLLFGLIDFLLAPYIMHPVQVLFDYPLAFTALGISGYFRNKGKIQMLSGIILSISLRFLFHFISGVVFYGSYAPEGQSAAAYSFLYNLSYIGPEALLCMLVLAILPLKQIYSVISQSSTRG